MAYAFTRYARPKILRHDRATTVLTWVLRILLTVEVVFIVFIVVGCSVYA